jgi:hypothetical protein
LLIVRKVDFGSSIGILTKLELRTFASLRKNFVIWGFFRRGRCAND